MSELWGSRAGLQPEHPLVILAKVPSISPGIRKAVRDLKNVQPLLQLPLAQNQIWLPNPIETDLVAIAKPHTLALLFP